MKNSINSLGPKATATYVEFDTIVIPQIDALKSFALKMTNDQDDADDLLQDTLMKAFRFFDKFEKGTNIKAWLFQIMKNSFINTYRKSAKEPNKVDYEDIQNFYENVREGDVKTQHYQSDAFNDVLDDEISNALSKLPDNFRTIVFLSDVEGYTYEEIADFIDCPIGTVRSRLHRARKMLFSMLYDYAKDKGLVSKSTRINSKLIKTTKKTSSKGTAELCLV
ncbi:MAG: RNA polymerase sigma factor RpoE [Ignavibacteria bacterium]|nr:MAG: RNA polymerase sigma factor RpoE [Ignavibacteria bacterium]KAF0161969.1 MAG: RNA polymerase sigma factor RpoE [Ignavibacteria bacterium]